MRDFHCPNCGQRLAFENSACLSCGSALGFSLGRMALLVIADDADVQLCANLHLAQCNWLVPSDQLGGLCSSCVLTIERPSDTNTAGLAEFARAEGAKRRLIAELHELKLPIVGRDQDPDHGLAFRLLSSAHENVTTGHQNGVITLISPKATMCIGSSCGSRWTSRIGPCLGTSATRSGTTTSIDSSPRQATICPGSTSCSRPGR